VPLVGFLPAIEQTGLLQSTFAISVFPKMCVNSVAYMAAHKMCA